MLWFVSGQPIKPKGGYKQGYSTWKITQSTYLSLFSGQHSYKVHDIEVKFHHFQWLEHLELDLIDPLLDLVSSWRLLIPMPALTKYNYESNPVAKPSVGFVTLISH